MGCGRSIPEPVQGASGGAQGAAGSSGELPASCRQPRAEAHCEAGFCRIEAGCYLMGAPKDEWGRGAVSSDQVQVTLTRSFEMSQTEITRAEWEALGLPQPNQHAQIGEGDCSDEDCPQSDVNFFDALEFANRYSVKRGLEPCYVMQRCTGELGNRLACASVAASAPSVYGCEGYRLPTEAEYEYAARAGATTAFYSGPISSQPDADCYLEPSLEPIGWYCYNSGKRPHPVAKKQANAWGLFDVSGNVQEWCNDLYKPLGYGTGPLIDPTGMPRPGSDLSAQPGEDRVARSGDYALAAFLSKNNWHVSFPDDAFGTNVGIRLVRTLP
jgi:formylglycine-generating enzyme required for sulfatase activity